jgi:uncharacterized membrane protein
MANRLGIKNKLNNSVIPAVMASSNALRSSVRYSNLLISFYLTSPLVTSTKLTGKKQWKLMEEESVARNATIVLADLREIEYFKSEKNIAFVRTFLF